jgi:hypothetical protein
MQNAPFPFPQAKAGAITFYRQRIKLKKPFIFTQCCARQGKDFKE